MTMDAETINENGALETYSIIRGPMSDHRFKETFCSQCGQAFGPGDNGFSHCVDHLTPCWTTKRPTVTGWYWFRYGKPNHHPMIVKVIENSFGLMLMYTNSGGLVSIGEGGEWAGPLAPPLEAK